MARKQKSAPPPNETREKLLHLAARIFGVEGYSATTMRQIADQAGIEAPSIYYHFPSKEALVDEVMAQGAACIVNELTDHIASAGPNATSVQRFRAAVLGQMSGMVKHGDYALAHSRLLGQLPEAVRDKHIKRREVHQKLWNGLLEDLRSEGWLSRDVDIHLARIFILGSINHIQSWFDPAKGTLESVADQLCDIFFKGVGLSEK